METTELNIRMLGDFSLSYGDTVIKDQHSRSGKVWTLLEYLVTFRDKNIPQDEIIDLLWPDDADVTDPSNTLKTLLHRLRTLLGQLDKAAVSKSAAYRRGSYRWAPTVPCRIDVEDFAHLCHHADTAPDDQSALTFLTQAIALYKGDFLPHSALEPWVIPIHTHYRNQYIKAVYRALEILDSLGRFDQMLAISQKAVDIDPYNERLHTALIKALLATGAQSAALQHYKHVTDLFFTQFGVSPSDELTDLYREVVKIDKNMELDLGIIKDGLNETPLERRAFFCEYPFFKDIYHLEARSTIRTGYAIHLALVTVSSNSAKPLTQKQLNTAMERLKEVIGKDLRQSDVFTRYSVSQYLIMLPRASFENSQKILQRVSSSFRHRYPKTPVMLQFKVLPLDPLSTEG